MSNRRQEFQLHLADLVRPLTDPDEVVARASELLGQSLRADRVVYAAVDDTGDTMTIERDWTSGRLPTMAGSFLHLNDFGPLLADSVRQGISLVLSNVNLDHRSAAFASAYTDLGLQAVLAIPLMKNGHLRALLNVHHVEPHEWTSLDVDMAEDMVDRTWAAVESARLQAELRHERDQSRAIFDSMTEGFALLDRHWRIVRMNAEGLRLTQQTAPGVMGRNHWELWPDLIGTQVEQLYREVMASRQAAVIDIPYRLPDGQPIWMEVRAYPSPDGGLALFFRNITERKHTEQALREGDQRKDEFLAMLAHELRNPLAPIGAAAELLQRVALDEEKVRRTSEVIGRQVRHMTSLIDDLLDVSRVTRGKVELDMECLDLRNVVIDAVEQITPLIRTRRHHLDVSLPPAAPLVKGDKKRLVQVLANLLNNAAKYTDEGGRIGVQTEVRDDRVLVHVSDNGIGMAPELVQRAFDLFTQAERSSDRSLGGLGLGLALVKSLIELHHGTVHCRSDGAGRGSIFTICLPHPLPDHDAVTPDDTDEPAAAPDDGKLRIMVVDDNVDAATMLAMVLEAAGHEVLVEHAPHAALARSREAGVHAFLLDIGLPQMDGYELARRLRAQPETAGALLVAVTGYGQDRDRLQTADAGFDHHLVKPVDVKRLYSILAEARHA
jgi:PAS domain S-box-containing protein